MTTKVLVLSFVVCAVVLTGGTFLFMRGDHPEAESRARKTTTPASSSPSTTSPADKPQQQTSPAGANRDDSGAEKPGSTEKPGIAQKPDPALAAVPTKANPDKPQARADDKPVLAADQMLKRWQVPPLTVPEGKNHFPMTNSAAINDDGTRVIIDNHPAVDLWDTADISYVRVQPSQDWGMGCNAILAQNTSRFYIRNDTTKKVEAYDGNGARIGTAPPIGFAPPPGLKRLGYDFAPRDYVMGSRLPGECGIFLFEPETGALRNVVPIKDIWDVEMCKGLVRLKDGGFLAYYVGDGATFRQGLHAINKDGKFTKVPGIPSKDMITVDSVSVSPDGRYLAFQGADRVEVWDRQATKLVLDWRAEYRSPLAARFSGDGRLAVLSVKTSIKAIVGSGLTGGYVNYTARLDVLEIPSLRVAGQLNLGEFDVLVPTFAFSPNGKRLVVADWKQVALVDVERTFPGE